MKPPRRLVPFAIAVGMATDEMQAAKAARIGEPHTEWRIGLQPQVGYVEGCS